MRVAPLALLVACSSPPRQVAPSPISVAPAPVAMPAPKLQAPDLRLPGDVKPRRFDVELTIVPDAERARGRVHVDANVVKPTRVVWMNATGLHVQSARLAGTPATVAIANDDFIALTAVGELPAGPLAIDIDYDAPIDHDKSRGIYAEREGSESYAYTFFEAIDARRAFPCFDEPAYKVPWKLVFHVRAGDVALGNAPVLAETPEPGGMKRVELADSKPLPSYLVAFVVGPFEVIDDGVAGRAKTPIRFVVPRGRADELAWAKTVTPRVVAALEDYFDMDYPYGKLDVAVVPRYWGTMEHPGIVAMGQPLTLIRGEQATRARKRSYANILAHELSHYWFGDYVTMVWWDDTWLNEALGEWSDMNITDAVEPGWRYRDERVGLATAAMTADETLAAQAMRQPVTTREGIQASFDGDLVYAKGSAVFRMFEAYVGADKWRAFIRAYLGAHAWANASATDFIAAMRDQLGEPVAKAFTTFLDQPGAPLVRATAACEGKSSALAVELSRAMPEGVTAPATSSWDVPLCFRYGDSKRTRRACALVSGPVKLTLEFCPTWVVANTDANGYYRSAIDPKLARALLDPRSPAKPSAAERMMIIADLRAMERRGELAIDQRLAFVPVIAADPDPKVAAWATDLASFHADDLDEPLYRAAHAWRDRAFGPLARALTWQRAAKDSDERHDLRRTVVPMIARDDARLGGEAEHLADDWLASRTGVDDDLVDAVLAVAAYRGDAARFERYLATVRHARDRAEQERVLVALGGFRDPALVKRAQELVLGRELDQRDSVRIVVSQLYHRDTRDLALAFLTDHIDELLAHMRDDDAALFLGALAGAFCDSDRRKRAGELATPRAAKFDGAQAAVARALERSDQCIAKLARDVPMLKKVLTK